MNIRQLLASLSSVFPWIAPVFQFLFRLVYSTMADLGSLLFQTAEEPDEEPNPDELFVSDEMTPTEKLQTFSKSDLILHRFFLFLNFFRGFIVETCGKIIIQFSLK